LAHEYDAAIDVHRVGGNNHMSFPNDVSDKEFPMSLTPAARRDLSFHLHPSTNLRSVQAEGPLVITRGEGVYVYDDEGRRYLEGMSGLWCASLGFSERRLAEAAYKQMCELPFYHSFAGKVPAISTELAERLIGIAPPGMTKVLFANSGSEANDTAIKLAWYVNNALGRPQKKKIISRQRAYHGVTIASGSLTGLAFAHNDFDLPIARFVHTDCPSYYRGAQPGESEEAFAVRLAANLEQLILREGPDTVAAFFAEPVMGAGGVVVPPATYFDRVQPILKKYDILFVVDEVICGFGRTGQMFGSQTFNLQPDIVTLAKALSAGYMPISANLVSGKLYEILLAQSDKLGIFGHGYTYSSHPVPAAVALEALRIYDELDILAKVRRVGPRLQAGIRSFADHPLIGEARGIGLIGAVEIVRDKSTKQSFDPKAGVAAFLVRRAQHHGVILRNMPGDIVAFCPPLIISEGEIDEVMAGFRKALDDTWAMMKEKGLA
jgi:4-aminobutyrate--pyruvate transaminase